MKPYGSTHPSNEETATIRAPRGKKEKGTSPEMEASDTNATPGEDQELFVSSSQDSRPTQLGTNQVPDKDGR
jgi:hypothetical protein